MGAIKRLDLQTTYRIRAATFRLYSYMTGLPSSVIKMSDYTRVIHSEASKLKIPEI